MARGVRRRGSEPVRVANCFRKWSTSIGMSSTRSASGGTRIGNPITNRPPLANGFFSVNLDFGVGVFTGPARWLDITVTNGGTTQTLGPRVQVSPTPYAQFATVAASVPNGSIMNAQLAGNVRAQCFCRALGRLLLGRHLGVALLFFCFDRMPRVTNFKPIGIADDLNRAVNAVAAVHDCIHNGLANHTQRQGWLILTRQCAFGQGERLNQLIAHRVGGAANRGKQWCANLQRVKAMVWVLNPLPAGHPDVVNAHHRKAAPQGHGAAK